jgi:hypothetical protein
MQHTVSVSVSDGPQIGPGDQQTYYNVPFVTAGGKGLFDFPPARPSFLVRPLLATHFPAYYMPV